MKASPTYDAILSARSRKTVRAAFGWVSAAMAGFRVSVATRSTSSADGLVQQIGAVRNLFVSSNGTLWGATSHGGLLRVDSPSSDQPRLSRLTMAEGLSSNEVGAVVEDDAGRIYAGTARGIDTVTLADQRTSRHGAADGIPVGEVFAAIKDRHGALWFGYSGGVVRFTPTDERPRPVPFVLIDGLSVDEQRATGLGSRTG